MTIKLHNPAPNPEKRETSVCEIELAEGSFFTKTSEWKKIVEKEEADCIYEHPGRCWLKIQILNWEEL